MYFTYSCHLCTNQNLPLTCHMYAYMQISSCADMRYLDHYIYLIYHMINSVTGNTGIHVFYVTVIWPEQNMPITLQTYVPLHVYHSLHIDSTLLPVLVFENCTFNLPHCCHICARNKYVTLKCQAYAKCLHYSMCINEGSMPIYMSHINNDDNVNDVAAQLH